MNYRNSDISGSLPTTSDKGLRRKGVADYRSGRLVCGISPPKAKTILKNKEKIVVRNGRLVIVNA